MPMQFTADSQQARKRVEEADQVVQRLLTFRRPYESRWAKLHQQLIGKIERRTYPDGSPRANIHVPYAFANVNYVRNTISEGLFSIYPPFEVLPVGARDGEAAYKMQPVMELLVLRKACLRSIISDFVCSLGVYGWAAIDIGWDWDFDFVYELEDQPAQNPDGSPAIDPITQEPLLQRVKVMKPIPRNSPKYTVLDIFDVAIDPDGAYIAKFFDKTISQMIRENANAKQAGQELYNEQALEKLKIEVLKDGNTEQNRNAIIRLCELWNVTDGTFTTFTTDQDLTSLSFKDERYANRSATYATFRRQVATSVPKTLLATGYNGFAHCRVPILHTSYTKLPHEVFGIGVIEPNYSLNNNLDKSVSMILDNWNVGVNQRFAYDSSSNFDTNDLINANVPGGMVGVYGNPSQILWPFPNHVPDPGSYSVLPLFQQMIERTANISDPYQRGIGSPTGNRTATGITSVLKEANKAMVQLVLQLTEDIIEPALQMTASNIQQFITDDIEVRITDEAPAIPKVQSQFLSIKPSELAGRFDFRIIGAAYMENRFVLQNNARQLVQMLAGSPYLKQGPAIRELFRLHRIPYPDRFVRSEEEVEAERQRQLLMAWLQAIAATRQNEADRATAAEAKVQGKQAPPTAQPKRPMPTVDEITGAVRQFAQRTGANAQGPPGQNAMGMTGMEGEQRG